MVDKSILSNTTPSHGKLQFCGCCNGPCTTTSHEPRRKWQKPLCSCLLAPIYYPLPPYHTCTSWTEYCDRGRKVSQKKRLYFLTCQQRPRSHQPTVIYLHTVKENLFSFNFAYSCLLSPISYPFPVLKDRVLCESLGVGRRKNSARHPPCWSQVLVNRGNQQLG